MSKKKDREKGFKGGDVGGAAKKIVTGFGRGQEAFTSTFLGQRKKQKRDPFCDNNYGGSCF